MKELTNERDDADGADRELVRAALGGSNDALDALVRRHHAFLHVARVERSVAVRARALRHLADTGYAHLFRGENRRDPPDLVARLRAVVSDRRFRAALDLDDASSDEPRRRRRESGHDA